MDRVISFSPKYAGQIWVPLFLGLTLFTLPLSSSGKSMFLALSVISILCQAWARAELMTVISKPWCIAGFALFGMALIACFWSPAPYAEQLFVVEKYSKLLYLPVLVVGFRHSSTRRFCIHAFLVAMLMTSALAILKFHGLLPSFNINPDKVFRNHIMTGFMLAFASYLSLILCHQPPRRKLQLVYLLLTVVYTYHVLFVNGGRMAYIIYLVIMLLLVCQLCSWRQAIVGVLLVGGIFTTCYLASPMMQERLHSLLQERHESNSSVGMRIQFHHFAHQLFNQHPLIGNGTASFTHDFRTLDPVPAWGHRLWEPHSQYWLIASEFGTLGLLILGFLFYSFVKVCWQLTIPSRLIAVGMLIPFFIGNLSDSLLFYSGSGYFFLLMMAICLGEVRELDIGPNRMKKASCGLV